jgi:hypothetical protein|tara:strand:+ start:1790 stop:3061 length:1272 start_codon:yes stop_codon:yes gene_type:complete
MAISTRTLLELCQEVARNIGVLVQGTASDSSGTASLISATYPFKTNLTNASTKEYENVELYDTESGTTLSPNPIGVTTYAPSTGVFSFSETASSGGGAGSTDTFDIYMKGVSLALIAEAVNKALRERYYTGMFPLTLVVDGDAETSGTGDWSSSNVTLTKITAHEGGSKNVLKGTQALKVVTTSPNGYTESPYITCRPGDNYYLEAAVSAWTSGGVADLIAYDKDNSAAIANETWTGQGGGKIRFTFQIPSSCYRLSVRIGNVGNSVTSYWDNIILYRSGSQDMVLPDWVDSPNQIRDVLCSTKSDRHDTDSYSTCPWYDIVEDEGNANNKYRVVFKSAISTPTWLLATRKYRELSAYTDTTAAPRRWIETAATVELLKILLTRGSSQNIDSWGRMINPWRRELARLDTQLMPKPIYHQRLPA